MEEIIRLTKQMHLNYIECEISNYYYHLGLKQKYQKKIDDLNSEYKNLLNNPPIGGSIIKMPSGSYNSSNWQLEFKGKIARYEEKRDLEDSYIKKVDKWLSEIAFDPKHLEVVELFLKKGINASIVAKSIRYSEDTVYKIKDRTLEKIYARFF